MAMPEQELNRKYTYKEYVTWDGRWELIEGIPYNMSPAPVSKHQDILLSLATEFKVYLRNKKCRVYVAPYDIRLLVEQENDEDTMNVVQPDISIICDPKKIDKKGCKGSPDLVVEILSPATAKKDRGSKFKLYERAGVKEYWIIDPSNDTLEEYKLQDDKYGSAKVYGVQDSIKVDMFEDLTIDLKPVFETMEDQ